MEWNTAALADIGMDFLEPVHLSAPRNFSKSPLRLKTSAWIIPDTMFKVHVPQYGHRICYRNPGRTTPMGTKEKVHLSWDFK